MSVKFKESIALEMNVFLVRILNWIENTLLEIKCRKKDIIQCLCLIEELRGTACYATFT